VRHVGIHFEIYGNLFCTRALYKSYDAVEGAFHASHLKEERRRHLQAEASTQFDGHEVLFATLKEECGGYCRIRSGEIALDDTNTGENST
jgi:hypothetical protein